MRTCWVVSLVMLLSLGGCSDDGGRPNDDGGNHDGPPTQDGTGPTKTLKWLTPDSLDKERAGKYATIVSCGAEYGVAYFRTLKETVVKTCPATFGGVPTDKPRPASDLHYVHFDGMAWGTPVKIDQVYGPPQGLSIAADSSCSKIHVGYLGGELSKQECNCSDTVIATSADKGQTWTTATINSAGPTGDTVGHWTSVAVDSAGAVHSAYRDVHFGIYEYDGNAKASLWFDTDKISGDNGAGKYASLLFDSSDQPVLVHYNGTKTSAEGGVQLMYKEGSAWKSKQLTSSNTTEGLNLAFSGQVFGVSYYKPTKQALYYMESSDLKVWSDVQVDTNLTRNGDYSSLAFDSKGNPAISYYLCNDYGESQCDFGKDGVNFAYRSGTAWKVYEQVEDGGPQRCGEYTGLAFAAGDTPVIAYKCVVYSNLAGEWVDTLQVIRGVYK